MFLNVRSSHCSTDSDAFEASVCLDVVRGGERCVPFISRFCGVMVLVMFIRGASGFEAIDEGRVGVLVPEGTGVCVATKEVSSLL